jgi:hypothetical protein
MDDEQRSQRLLLTAGGGSPRHAVRASAHCSSDESEQSPGAEARERAGCSFQQKRAFGPYAARARFGRPRSALGRPALTPASPGLSRRVSMIGPRSPWSSKAGVSRAMAQTTASGRKGQRVGRRAALPSEVRREIGGGRYSVITAPLVYAGWALGSRRCWCPEGSGRERLVVGGEWESSEAVRVAFPAADDATVEAFHGGDRGGPPRPRGAGGARPLAPRLLRRLRARLRGQQHRGVNRSR